MPDIYCQQHRLIWPVVTVAQPSRLRVRAPSRCSCQQLAARRRLDPQARTLALRVAPGKPQGNFVQELLVGALAQTRQCDFLLG
jgi:hypothetical protein